MKSGHTFSIIMKNLLSIRSYSTKPARHSHHFNQLVLPLRGVINICVGNFNGKVAPSECVVVKANEEHLFTADTEARSWGVAFNVNDNLSVSYGDRDVEFNTGGTIVDEETNGVAIAYTMGSIKIAGNRNEQTNAGGTSGSDDAMTEVALSFAF